jgi:hypothetical protein
MCIPIARQRLGKHIPAKRTHATGGRPLLGNGPAKHASVTVEGPVEKEYLVLSLKGFDAKTNWLAVNHQS